MPSQKKSYFSLLFKIALTLFVLFIAGMVYLDSWLMAQFKQQTQATPSVVYARPLELYQGLQISQQAVIEELKANRYQASTSAQAGTYYATDTMLIIYLRPFVFADGTSTARKIVLYYQGDTIESIKTWPEQTASVRLAPISIGKIYAGQLEDRLLVDIADVPPALIYALLATEDRDFFNHHGISLKAIGRAFLSNLKHGGIQQGGSTLTQQLVKNLYLSNQRSYSRKLLEVALALLLELHVDKKTILQAYINEVYVAQDGNRAIHGFGLASRYLFNQDLAQLDMAQCALLVAMMKGPSYYNPLQHPERARQRRDLVLDLMAQLQFVSQADVHQARQQPLQLSHDAGLANYPAYLDLVRQQLLRDYSMQQLENQGLKIFSNMDPQWQWHSQQALSQGIARLEKSYRSMPELNGGALVVNYNTGDVLAVVGDKKPRYAGFNRALDAKRQIGSLIKPAVYLTALEQGYSLASMLPDTRVAIKTAQGVWQPHNYSLKEHGDVLLIDALAHSYNLATVHLGLQLGLPAVSQTLKRLGIDTPIPQVPSLFLGTLELTPLAVSQMYTTLAANGFYTPLKAIREVVDSNGHKLKRYPLQWRQVIKSDHQYLIDFALQWVMHKGTGQSVLSQFNPQAYIAGKTGTSSQQRDSWFAGYNQHYLSVVWLGDDHNKPLPITGGTGALPIWAQIMQQGNSAADTKPIPDDIGFYWVDKNNALLSDRKCKDAIYLPFVNGNQPQTKARCDTLHRSFINWFKQ